MKKTETKFQQAIQMEAVHAIAGGIIHDINNILSSILGFAELAKMGLRSGANVEKDLDEVVNAGLNARDLVSQLLVFIRHAGIRKMPIEVALLIKESVKLLRALLPASIEIDFHPGDFKGKILTDSVQFYQILIILCTNASHVMKEKAGRLEIRLEDTSLDSKDILQYIDLKPGKYLQLSIGDRASEMSAEIRSRICAPFHTPDRKEGAFPGLSLVQGIVREMGGAISVCNKSDKGILFHILFPKYEKESGD